jgi:RNA polymerase sigma factor (TIGR02999 family)
VDGGKSVDLRRRMDDDPRELLPRPPHDVTGLLLAWRQGNQSAFEQLIPIVYDELRRLARGHLRGERRNHTLQTAELVHETYVRLVDSRRVQWQNRAHFFAVAAQCMRRILVDSARARQALKRGGDQARVELDPELTIAAAPNIDLVALDEALSALAAIDERRSRVVELRFFGGLSVEETAGVLDVSPETVMRDWKVARAWLFKQLTCLPPGS